MNNPPFYIGQRVVALKSVGPLRKDYVYTVAQNIICSKCGLWHTTLVEFPSNGWASFLCLHCDTIIPHTHCGGSSKMFAPIEENRIKYVAVSETLREKAVEIAAIETN